MYYKFIYKNKETGASVYSQKELKDEKLELVKSFKDTAMKSEEVIKK